VMFSDGIPEAQRGDEFYQEARLRQALVAARPEQGLGEVCRTIIQSVDDFLVDTPRGDDITLVLLRRE
jgi:serine phosphatase RsbU (regulator of sigma subunit)